MDIEINYKNSSSGSYQKWIIWAIAGIFYLYEMVLRVSPSVMTHDLMKDFHVYSCQLGVLTSFYYYSYVVLQVPCGVIVDKLGIRRIITFSAILCVIGTFLFASSNLLWIAQIGRFLIGAGSACAFLSCLKVSADWFKPHQFALIAGLTNMMGTLGGTLAGGPLSLFVNALGWREASIWLAIIGIGVALISFFFLKDKPTIQTNSESFSKNFSSLIKNKKAWITGIIGGLMYLPVSAFAELWGVPFLMNTYQIDNVTASSASTMVLIGMALGSPLIAYLLNKINSVVKVMTYSALSTTFLFFVISCAQYYPLSLAFVFLFLAGVCIGGQVLCFTLAKDSTPPELSGTVVGFTNAVVMMSGIIYQPLLGYVLDFFWDGHFAENGHPLYTAHAYHMALLVIPISLIISLVLLRFVKENHSKPRETC